MATYDIVLTGGTEWTDSGIPAGRDVNLPNRYTYRLEYRTGATQPAAAAVGISVLAPPFGQPHPVKIGAGEKLWVRMPDAGAGTYEQVAVDG